MIGKRFGDLCVVARAPNGKHGHSYWHCRCDCGEKTVARGNHLRSGQIASCGHRRESDRDGKPPRTVRSAVWIPLSKGAFALVGARDAQRVMAFKWRLHAGGYAVRQVTVNGKKVDVFLHNFLRTPPPGFQWDHKNRNRLDNRRSNLRRATLKQNARNSKWQSGVSGFIGVRVLKSGRYQARLVDDTGRLRVLGTFDDAERAARERDRVALRVRGQFAVLNFGRRGGSMLRPEVSDGRT